LSNPEHLQLSISKRRRINRRLRRRIVAETGERHIIALLLVMNWPNFRVFAVANSNLSTQNQS